MLSPLLVERDKPLSEFTLDRDTGGAWDKT
jgi:hypothetical protein